LVLVAIFQVQGSNLSRIMLPYFHLAVVLMYLLLLLGLLELYMDLFMVEPMR